MTRYQVRVSVDYSEYYEVEADTKEEAMDKVLNGEVDVSLRKIHNDDSEVFEID